MVGRMIRRVLALLVVALAAAVPSAWAQPAPARGPVLVELYTSQGCSACPRANRLLGELSHERDVLALTFAVGYWDYLGWIDTFARPEFADRQRAYARSLRFRAPYTPQLIVDGAAQARASRQEEARVALDEARAAPPAGAPPPITLSRAGNRIRIAVGPGATPAQAADIWMITFDSGPLNVLITRGENAGYRVAHYNLVRRIARVGVWTGGEVAAESSRCSPRCAIIIQAPQGGRVLAVAVAPEG